MKLIVLYKNLYNYIEKFTKNTNFSRIKQKSKKLKYQYKNLLLLVNQHKNVLFLVNEHKNLLFLVLAPNFTIFSKLPQTFTIYRKLAKKIYYFQ